MMYTSRLIFLLSALILLSCQQQTSTPATPPAMLPVKVKIAQPLIQEVTEWDDYQGRIEATESVDVRARVSGYLEKINFTAGAKVKKGDLLFVIDPKPLKAQLDFALAELEKAKSRRDLAKNDLTRAENLFKEKAASAEEYDNRQKGLREANAAIQSAQAQVDTARLNLQYTEVRAPIDGRISREYITAGNLVNGSGGDATRLATIISINPVYVYVDVDEKAVLKYRRQHKDIQHTEVQLGLADEQGFPHSGKLDYVAPMENLSTGTVAIRAVFKNDDELLVAGFFARIRINTGATFSAVLLPDRAIGADPADRFVWVVGKDNKASYRKVELGEKIGALRVIKQGLQADESVVIEGVQKLKSGSSVNPEIIKLEQTAG
ncbi:Efflux pump periplasmic linker BepF [uncultured bacterium]|nr:Efflux pump periplasmic linker BepF [uncultured bacterium]